MFVHREKNLPDGYMGNILHIDLSEEKFDIFPTEPEMARLFFGGRGFGTALLFRHFLGLLKDGTYENPYHEIDGLSPDNPVIISSSPAAGTRMPGSGRFHMNFKSPLTDGIGSSNSGGFWGVQMKLTGIDAMYITGKAERPVYIVVRRNDVSFHDASPYLDSTTEEISEELASRLPGGARVLSIGPAGKKMVRFAAVINEKGRALGRSGGGAVWGSKNLHAIAVVPDASLRVKVSDPDMLNIRNEKSAAFKAKMMLEVGKLTRKESHYGILSSLGSLGLLGMVHSHDQLPHNNMRDNRHDADSISRINGEALRRYDRIAEEGQPSVTVKKGTCFNCPVACKRETKVYDGDGVLIDAGEGPEFETVTLLGANLSIYDLPLITRANYAANRMGMDTISLGSTIGALFDLYETCRSKTDLNKKERMFMSDVSGLLDEIGEPVFGNSEVLLPLIGKIGLRQGIGEYLAEGSYRFCSRYGHPELSMTVKGQELPAYDPRASFSQALSYEMSNRGGCHLEGGYMVAQTYAGGYGEWPGDRIEGTPLTLKNAAFRNTIYDTICACMYTSFSIGLDDYANLLNAVTGLKYNAGMLQKLGHRVFTLERLFNVMCGKTAQDDWLPERFYSQSVEVDGKQMVCSRQAFEKMHQEYYSAMGWDRHGQPGNDILEKLELAEFVSSNTEVRR